MSEADWLVFSRRRIAPRGARIDREFAEVRSVQRLHSWMLGTLLALNVTILFKVFSL